MTQERIETRHKRIELSEAIPLPAPFTLRVDPCGACNFKCRFCPCNQSDYRANERHQRMTWETFQCVLDGMKEWAARDTAERPGQELSLKVVDFHGFGEPLLNPLLADMVRAVKEAKVCREIRLVTNGSLLTPEKSAALIDAGLDLCRVSVYALEREDYRTICGVNLDPERIVQNVKDFYQQSRNTGSRISAKIVSTALRTKEDEERFHKIYDPITDFSFVEEVGDVWPGFDIGSVHDGEHIQGVKKAFGKYGSGLYREKRKICTAPFTEMQIHADGAVSPCSGDWAREMCYGNVTDKSLNLLWNGKTLRELWLRHLDRSAYEGTGCVGCMAIPPDSIDENAEIILNRLAGGSGLLSEEACSGSEGQNG